MIKFIIYQFILLLLLFIVQFFFIFLFVNVETYCFIFSNDHITCLLVNFTLLNVFADDFAEIRVLVGDCFGVFGAAHDCGFGAQWAPDSPE